MLHYPYVHPCCKTHTNVFFPVCLFRVMNSICRRNYEKSLSILTIMRSRETACLALKFFSQRVYLCGNVCKYSIRHICYKISMWPPCKKEVGHPVSYIVLLGTIYMEMRSVAEKHLGRCKGQGDDFWEVGKELLKTHATCWIAGRGKLEMVVNKWILLRFIYRAAIYNFTD